MHNTTFHSLSKWFKKEVEKFGWMVIFNQEYRDDNKYNSFRQYTISLYIKTLERLLHALEYKWLAVTCNDKKNDLYIMKSRLATFIPFVTNSLSNIKSQEHWTSEKMDSASNDYNPITFHGASKWFKYSVEKLGWMVMFSQEYHSTQNDDTKFKKLKLYTYLKSLEILTLSIHNKINSGANIYNDDLIIIRDKLNKYFIENAITIINKVTIDENMLGDNLYGGGKNLKNRYQIYKK
jgi:hypothetical protein